MNDKELLEEIRLNRSELYSLHKDFTKEMKSIRKDMNELKVELEVFKTKSRNFTTLVSSVFAIVVSLGLELFKTKIGK